MKTTGAALAHVTSNRGIERIKASCFILKKPIAEILLITADGNYRAIQVIGLTFCTFLPRQFALASPDSILNKAQAINFLFYALVTCDSWQIGYIDNRMKTTSPTPDAILQTAFGFWNSKVLLTAVTFDLFSTLDHRRLTGPEIGKKLDLHPRGVADFLDALVAMKFLEREGDGAGREIFQHARHRSVSRPQQPALHRWNPGDAQYAAVQV